MFPFKLATEPFNTIALPFDVQGLPKTIEHAGDTLLLKDHFHVSLVCIGQIIKKFDPGIEDIVAKINKDFTDFVSSNEVKIVGFNNEYRFCEENEKKAIICMCDISNLNLFFDLINGKYGLSVPYPPFHATLYTLQPNVGIFLTDADDLDRLTRKIENPIGQDLNTFLKADEHSS